MATGSKTRQNMISAAVLIGLLAASTAGATPPHPATGLVGQGFDQVREALGEPDVAQADGAGALWTYRLDACALMIAFHNGASGFRVSEVMSGPRRRGEKPLPPTACAQSGEAAHRAGPSPPTRSRSAIDPLPPAAESPR